MKIFKGKLQQLNAFSGKIRRKRLGLTVEILPLNAFSEVTIRKEKMFSGRWYDKIRFSGSVNPLPALYRFLSAWSKFFSRHEAKAITAPTIPVEIDTAFVDETDATPSAHEAKCVTIDQKARIVRFVNLKMSWIALLKFIKGIGMKHDVRVNTADGIIAKYRKRLDLKRLAKGVVAGSAVIESQLNKVKNGVIAPAITGEAECIKFTGKVLSGKTAKAETADTIDVSVDRAMVHSYKAAPFAWFMTEQSGNRVKIFQAFSAIQSSNRVAIDKESESAYWANPHIEGNRAKLVFAESAIQNDNRLELI